jgi:hypothetical protein
VWYRINSLGHIVRYIQLEKSRTRPPSPRYMFEIINGTGIMYVYPIPTRGKSEVVEDEKLGISTMRRSTICIHSDKVRNLIERLSQIKDKSLFLQIGHWTSFHGLEIEEKQVYIVKTFHDLFKLLQDFYTKKLVANYIVTSGLLNLPEEDRKEYISVLYALLGYTDFLILADVGSRKETESLKKYCEEVIEI